MWKCPSNPPRFLMFSQVKFNATVNSYDTRPTAPGFRIFFQLKRASRKPFQIPCVFSMRVSLAFKVIVNLNVMRSIAPTFRVFSEENAPRRNPAAFPGFTFLVFSQVVRVLRSRSDCEFTCDAANCSLIPNTFPRKTRLAWLSVPHKPRVALVRKGNAGSCHSQFFKTHVTPKGWDVKGGIPQDACWRLGCGEARQTLKHDRAIPKTTAVQGHAKEMQWNCPYHVHSAVWQHGSESIKFCFACGG